MALSSGDGLSSFFFTLYPWMDEFNADPSSRGGLETEIPRDRLHGTGFVEGIKMDARDPKAKQTLALSRRIVDSQLDRTLFVALYPLDHLLEPRRDLRAAQGRETP